MFKKIYNWLKIKLKKSKIKETIKETIKITPPDFEFETPKIIEVPNIKFTKRNYATKSGKFSGLVVHYTVSSRTKQSAVNVLKYLSQNNLMCMVMDEEGVIYIPEGFDIFKNWGYHAGVSKWRGMVSVSNVFAGMEVCCWGRNSKVGPYRISEDKDNIIAGKYQMFTEAQEKSLINFIFWAKANNPEFQIQNVVGHDELRAEAGKRGDKQDPGASLSWTLPEFREMLLRKINL